MKYLILLCYIVSFSVALAQKPDLLLANIYKPDILLNDYWVSEKLDGVRAYWDGKQLISRQGTVLQAPKWFIQPLPQVALDGELWLGRQQFSNLSGIVRQKKPNNELWKQVKYMIFDLPNSSLTFDQRIVKMQNIIHQSNAPHFQMIRQYKVSSKQALSNELSKVVNLGGEGLMLHKGNSLYHSGRSNDLLKVKQYNDAEATVIKHITGKGKFKGMLGAMLVETKKGLRFKIGSGFSLKERQNPPPIGSLITYKYFGLTKNGQPRFASYMRIRNRP